MREYPKFWTRELTALAESDLQTNFEPRPKFTGKVVHCPPEPGVAGYGYTTEEGRSAEGCPHRKEIPAEGCCQPTKCIGGRRDGQVLANILVCCACVREFGPVGP